MNSARQQSTLAIDDYQQAISLQPKYHQALAIGNEYAAQKEYSEAIEQYSQAIEINSEYVEAYYNRAWAYQALGQHQQAIQDLVSLRDAVDYLTTQESCAIALRTRYSLLITHY